MNPFKSIRESIEANLRNRSVRSWLPWVLLLASSVAADGQSNRLETDKGITAAIAPYDADVRRAILQTSQYPWVLMQLQKTQVQTVASFQNVIRRFRRKKQEWFYTLSRYPDLMHSLANLQANQSQNSVYKLLPNQDPGLQEAAWKLYSTEKKSLVKVDNIRIAANREFEKAISRLDRPTREAFHKLQALPDVLTLLTNNIELTTRLGEHYKNNPVQVTNHLTALHDNLEVQNQYENAAFKKQMDSDPQAMKELSQAATDYSNSNGYGSSYQQNYWNSANYYGSPYSYWFGYQYWYSYPLWYLGVWPYPGFYFGLGGIGLYGFPSYSFSIWFFSGGYYRRYPNLYHQFGNYYRRNLGANRVMGSVNRGFMGVANAHYNPANMRLNTLTTPTSANRGRGQLHQRSGTYTTHSNANTYHAQSWGGYGGRVNAVGGGFHGGHGGRH